MHPKTRIILSAALVAALSPLSALAQSSGFELIPHVGYRTAGNFDLDDPAGLDSDLEIDESEAYGVAFDIPLTQGGGLKLELSLSRQESALNVDEGLFFEGERLGDLDVTYAQVGLLYQWQAGQVQPYVVVAGGIAKLEPQFGALDDEDRPAFSLGGGVKIFFSETIGLRLEGRGYAVALDDSFDDDDFCRNHHRDDCASDDTLTQGEATVGLIFRW